MPSVDELEAQVAEANGAPASDRLAQVRERARKIAADKSLTLLVPGYEGLLGIRYHGIPRGEMDDFVNRAQKAGERGQMMAVNADLLIRCCEAILVRRQEGAEWEPLDLDTDQPTTFSTATLPLLLPEFVGDASKAREEVFGLFSPGGGQAMAVGQHSDALISWLGGKAEEIDRTLLGE